MQKIKSLFKKKIFSIPAIAIIVVLIIIILSSSGKQNSNIFTVKKTNLIQDVSVSGKINSANQVDLAFEKGGRVSSINAEVSDKVYAGEVIVRLENGDLVAQLDQARANIKIQQARLDELKRGSRPEEIQIKQTELAKAQQDLNNYYSSIPDVLNDAFSKADDALHKQVIQTFSSLDTPRLTFDVDSVQLRTNTEGQIITALNALKKWKNDLDSLTPQSSSDTLFLSLEKSLVPLNIIRDSLDKIMNSIIHNINLTQSTADTYKANANTARNNVNTAITNISDQKATIESQKIAVKKISDELALKLAGSDPKEISIQEAEVESAKANARNFEAQINKTLIIAPISGIITKQDAKVGEIISPNITVVSLISESKFQIEANIPEINIANIKIGDEASVTLDAYGSNNAFPTKVVKIDPAETIVEGVSTYKVTLQFLTPDPRIKSGMTANVQIKTGERKNILVIPQRAIIIKDKIQTVKILKNGVGQDVEIKTGLRGSDGNIEVLSGLNENDQIIIPS
ncbi:MAG: efflux RND transporter periplasmic adaptor subunit [Candidatus Paceibacterota bacterium]|jgi:HlyD family secretion protein